MSAVYGGYDQAELDALYNTRGMVPDHERYTAGFERRSQQVAARHPSHLDLRYGNHPRQRLDLFLPEDVADPPVNVFFHGGYWRSADKERYRYLADGFLPAGAALAVVEYALIPTVDMDELVAQCRAAVAWLWAAGLPVDRDHIHVSGHSAGGHIVGMLMADGWAEAAGLPADVIKGGCGVSGLYDLEPIRHTYLNGTLALDESSARRNSPAYHRPASAAPLVLAVGGEERSEFLRQTELMERAWRRHGCRTRSMVLDGMHHYSIVESLGDPGAPLTRAMHRQMEIV
jgi:arylformamidase